MSRIASRGGFWFWVWGGGIGGKGFGFAEVEGLGLELGIWGFGGVRCRGGGRGKMIWNGDEGMGREMDLGF